MVTHEVDQYRVVRTRNIAVHVTAEHPFYVGNGTFKTLEALKVGDSIFAFDGRGLSAEPIESIATVHQKVVVYNLQTDAPNTFLANGLLVHNKGGGSAGRRRISGGGSGGSADFTADRDRPTRSVWSGSSPSWSAILVVLHGRQEALPLSGTATRISTSSTALRRLRRKSGKTLKLLEFLSRQDPAMAPEALRKQAETAFLKLQQCWAGAPYEPMRPLLMPDLFRNHSLQIAQMVRQHEINVIGDLRVDRIDLVNVRYTFKEEQREFTALITATACDYYIDDRTRQRLRGDTAPAQFQEFWTFQLHNKTWLRARDRTDAGIGSAEDGELLRAVHRHGRGTDLRQGGRQGGPGGPLARKKRCRPRRPASSGCSISSSRPTRFGTARRCWKPPAGYSWR